MAPVNLGKHACAYEPLLDAAWPSLERHDTGEWVLRAAAGVTQRANSVWPRNTAGEPDEALREAVQWYRQRRLPLIFQLTDTDANAGLNDYLDEQGFTRQSETLILSRPAGTEPLPPASANVEFLDQPDDEWLALWWSVDGRGGAEELDTAAPF